MQISFRPATAADYAFCEGIYVAEAKKGGASDMAAVAAGIRERWEAAQVRIIGHDGADVGWLQCEMREGALFIRQFMIDEAFQRRGIGVAVLQAVIAEAAKAGHALTLGVVKTNPARRLYERLGFTVTHDDERKFYMRRENI